MKVLAKIDMEKVQVSSIEVNDDFRKEWQPDKIRIFERDINSNKANPTLVTDSLTGNTLSTYWLDIIMEKPDE